LKNLRHVADRNLIREVYRALCESLITYCISCWGGAPKTKLISLERAQRAVLKVGTFKPIDYSTKLLYHDCQVLTVRQLFILNVIKRQHQLLNFDPEKISNRRRKDIVVGYNFKPKTVFVKKYFGYIGPFLYNKINKHLSIYNLNRHECNIVITAWLQQMSYDETEALMEMFH
jgi:hypothetical protein